MNEDLRIEMLNTDAAFLRAIAAAKALPSPDDMTRVLQVAHNMERFATLVFDRDAGPNRDLKAQNLQLQTALTEANRVAQELDTEYLAYREKTKPLGNENSRLRDVIVGLEKDILDLQKTATPLPTDEIPELPIAQSAVGG